MKKATSPKRSKLGLFLAVFGVSLFVAFVLARVFVYEPFRIPSGSMMPTLQVGDYILVYKWPYGRYGSYGANFRLDALKRAKPKRGEVFVFDYPINPELNYVKRVIGLPGDRIAFHGHELLVNGEPVKRESLSAFVYQKAGLEAISTHVFKETVGTVHYKILLHDGKVPDYLKSGEVVVPPGQYFMMGDNRDDAMDSRYWGFVPEENLVGKVDSIFISSDMKRTGKVAP